jgi:hypothetical protein
MSVWNEYEELVEEIEKNLPDQKIQVVAANQPERFAGDVSWVKANGVSLYTIPGGHPTPSQAEVKRTIASRQADEELAKKYGKNWRNRRA